jgi:hypothetical protein
MVTVDPDIYASLTLGVCRRIYGFRVVFAVCQTWGTSAVCEGVFAVCQTWGTSAVCEGAVCQTLGTSAVCEDGGGQPSSVCPVGGWHVYPAIVAHRHLFFGSIFPTILTAMDEYRKYYVIYADILAILSEQLGASRCGIFP